MNDELPTYRLALKDSSHPFYEATWLIFSEDMNEEYAAKRLAPQKDALIPYLFDIIDDVSLRDEGSLGRGVAPLHAIDLLGEWKVTEAAPRLLEIFEHASPDQIIAEAASLALEQMGPGIVDDLLQMLSRVDDQRQFQIASIFAEVGKGDQRVFDWLKSQLVQAKDEFDTHWYAEYLMACDKTQAVPVLKEQIKMRKDRAVLRDILDREA